MLVLFGICGLSSYFVMVDERGPKTGATGAAPVPTTLARDISSRAADPAPLTVKEVFPGDQIVIESEESAYQVLKTQGAQDCGLAASGQLGALLKELGCNQFVRGTVRSPTGSYLATAGIVNLADAAGADSARQRIKPIVDGEDGRFLGMAAGQSTEPVTRPSAQAGWHVRGHFLVYCVVARVDGETIGADDPFARQVLSDMIEAYLRGKVLERRATVPASPTGEPSN
ncbi:hypothetical protein [Plantactinospora sp. CA-290183]|uniref:hypothetical protein n=1 Tax=Plantactinospora sp. CA-290183 TaxID=3240006 RepID=UPI003D8B9E7A